MNGEEFNKLLSRQEKADVKLLGDRIGYGRMFQLAQELWREYFIENNWPPGSEFSIGPCVGLTVKCGCGGMCDWCEGAGWLTQKAKDAKDKEEKSL